MPSKSKRYFTVFIHLCLGLIFIDGSAAFAQATDPLFIIQSISIARKLVVNPAADLEDPNAAAINGEQPVLDSDEVASRMKAGVDVSTYRPAPTDIWGGTLKARDIQYPKEGADGYVNIRFDSLVTSPRGLTRSRVVTDDETATPYRMVMSWNLHSALMNAELLTQLGYTIDHPRRYSKARLRFADVASRELFLTELAGGTGTPIEQWLIKTPAEKDLVIELRDFALEPARIATPPYYWGAISRNELQNRRVVRALLIPLILTSIPDSINLWTWEVGKLVDERVLLFHPFAGNFQGQLNYEDGRWIARSICAIDEAGLHKIIKAGGYPEILEPLLYEKLKARRNHLLELFEIQCQPLPVTANINVTDSQSGEKIVVNGKLLKSEFEGYGFKFIGHDPESPLRKDELFRYMRLRGLGVALNAGLSELNSKLLTLDQSDSKQFQNNRWAFKHGPREKLNLSANRKLVSGTYYGSEQLGVVNPVQLLDQVSISATLGYFVGIRNRAIKTSDYVDFNLSPNVAISRSYLHVKPMKSMQEAIRTPWKDLPVVSKMRSLAKILDGATEADQDTALNSFLEQFGLGENFSIVDSIDMGVSVGADIPLPPMAAVPNFGKLSLSAGFDHLLLRRTMIQRQIDGSVQITLHRAKKNLTNFSMGYNFLVDVTTAAASGAGADSNAVVFVIDPTAVTTQKEFNRSLRALLVDNDSTELEKDFKPYHLDHDLDSRTRTLKVLPFSFARYHEEHKLEAVAPGSVSDDEHRRELYSIRDRRLSGSDWLGFGTKSASKVSNEYLLPDLNIDLSEDDGQLDPSGSFLGRSHWREVQLESELTPYLNEKALMTVQETYMGWTLSKNRMLRIMHRLEAKAHDVNRDAPSLIHGEEFLSTNKLLLYQITSSLKVSGPGLDVLTRTAKAAPNEEAFLRVLTSKGRINYSNPDELAWVNSMYRLLRLVPERGNTFAENRERIRKLYSVSKYLANEMNPKQVIQLIGREDAIFQISVAGFRKNDENGDSSYLSASIGENNDVVDGGAFSSFVRDQNISTFEVRGTYLGSGL
jgi:hypothetical protein